MGINAALVVTSSDTLVGVQPAGALGNDPESGAGCDGRAIYRMIAPMANVPSSRFRAHNDYMNTGGKLTQFAHGLTAAGARGTPLYYGRDGRQSGAGNSIYDRHRGLG